LKIPPFSKPSSRDPVMRIKASFHSGKLSVDWNGQEHFSLC
jgi:hypothetical protein